MGTHIVLQFAEFLGLSGLHCSAVQQKFPVVLALWCSLLGCSNMVVVVVEFIACPFSGLRVHVTIA